MGLPRERGRQTELAKQFGFSPNAARKWLNGDGMPELENALRIANWAEVTIVWLLQGLGPKRGDKIETKAIVLDEALHSLPVDDGQQVLDFIRYKIEKADGPIVGERLARYMTMLDAFGNDMKRKKE